MTVAPAPPPRARPTPLLLAAAFALAAAVLAATLRKLGDFDLPWHLATGRSILTQGLTHGLPHALTHPLSFHPTDDLSYTFSGAPLRGEFLADTLLFTAFRLAGPLGLASDVGSIEPGKKADLIIVDTRAPHLIPARDPISTLVYAAHSSDVRDVLIDGRLLVKNRRLTELSGLDQDDVVHRAATEAHRVEARASVFRI